uniref:Nucleotidyltransferase n=1 Tax=Candidatus Kentrum sp. LFY TaxID=2126342 RepID=A0A450WHQ1_9GAMM|nr:MAG: hypothetical protein BECKLFY1418C_GA0070996_102419 [Candidatus Kentron sp. LFY]
MPTRLDRLSARRIDPDDARLLNEVYTRMLVQTDSVKYVVGAMQPIDPGYTKNTYAAAERVWNQLDSHLTIACDREYQGSVTNDTHIKAKSDIDVLLLVQHFFGLEPPQIPANPYMGDPVQDLLNLRKEVIDTLPGAFPLASVDSSGSKSISIEGGSLRRKVDVVPSNWYNTNEYVGTNQKIYRGVQILDAKHGTRLKNTPFLHNTWIDQKDNATIGGLRKAARLLKSLKYDTESIDLSSYDLVSIAFNIPDWQLSVPHGMELSLLHSCYAFCEELSRDAAKRNSLWVPDRHRRIFEEGHATKHGLDALVAALWYLENDVLRENQRSFRKLEEARVEY